LQKRRALKIIASSTFLLLLLFQNCSGHEFYAAFNSIASSPPVASAAATASLGNRLIFYVSPQGNDSWSGTLSDPWNNDGPFKTIARGVKAIGDNAPFQQTRGVALLIREGIYYLDAPLSLSPSASGSVQMPTVMQNYNHERVVISGGKEITGWHAGTTDTNILIAPVPAGTQIADSFQGLRIEYTPSISSWASLSRWPKKSNDVGNPDWQNPGFWLYAKGTPTAGTWDPSNMYLNTVLNPTDNAALSQWDLSSAQIQFFSLSYDVRSLPMGQLSGGAILTLTGPYGPTTYLPDGMRFAISNIPGAINLPNEWAIDRGRGIVYYKNPAAEAITSKKLILSNLHNLIIIGGTETNFVQNIKVQGLIFADTSVTSKDYFPTRTLDFAFEISYGKNIVVRNNLFAFIGNAAICVRNKSDSVSIVENVIEHVGESGIELISTAIDVGTIGARSPTHTLVQGNYLSDVNHSLKGAAIMAYSANDSVIDGNLINLAGGPGIQILGTPDSTSARNTISYNDVQNAFYGLSDGGGIYISSGDPTPFQNQVLNNRILNIHGADERNGQLVSPTGGVGIYLDNFESGDFISGNIVCGTSAVAMFVHDGSQNSISNNLFMNGGERDVMVGAEGPISQNLFMSNAIGVTGTNFFPMTAIWTMSLPSKATYSSVMASGGNFYTLPDPNGIWSSNSSAPTFYNDLTGNSSGRNFAAWLGMAEDTNSGIGGPSSDFILDSAGNIVGLNTGYISAIGMGPLPNIATGLQHYLNTSILNASVKDCLTPLLGNRIYDFTGTNMPAPESVYGCYQNDF
jgi:hypothetical protein